MSLMLTILYVRDLEQAAGLYDRVFRWRKTVDAPVYVEFEVAPQARLGLMPQGHTGSFLGRDLGDRRFEDGCPRAEVYIRVSDALPVVARLEAEGLEALSPLQERDWGDRAAYFLDPDGYVLAIAEPA
jgi:catechol 2,3-dioxygenase-like lactoylglutathione lyase family enzyme